MSASPVKRRETRDRRWKSFSSAPGPLTDINEVSGPSGESDTGKKSPSRRQNSESSHREKLPPASSLIEAAVTGADPSDPVFSSSAPTSCHNSDTDTDSDELDETARIHQRLFKLQQQQEALNRKTGADPHTVLSLAVPAAKSGSKPRPHRKSSSERRSSAERKLDQDGGSSGASSRRSSAGSCGSQLDSGSGGKKLRRKSSSGSRGLYHHDGRLKRVPSSLFYIDYDAADDADDDYDDDDDDNEYEDISGSKETLDLPPSMSSSRKISAVMYSDFVPLREEAVKTPLGPFLGSQSKAAFVDACYTDRMKEIDAIMKPFRMADEQYKEVTELMSQSLDKGLGKETNREASVKMYPTYVRALPTGQEMGRFLALDLGGTNFRILLVDLKGREAPEVTSKQFLVPNKIMRGSGRALFDHIAQCIAEFLGELNLKSEKHPLGFTFSFACAQVGLASARLVRWSKGFCCSGVEGEDVVQLLLEAVQRRGDIQIECFGILNDNVGVLMTAARSDPNCLIGLILGTGTNCCYMEDLGKVELWDEDFNDPKQVIINTEWGAFGDDGCLDSIRNRYDLMVDEESLNKGRHLYEKMISGMYMGEIVRFVLCDLATKGLLFEGNSTEELNEPYRFYTKYISEIESDDPTGEFLNTKSILEELSLSPVTIDDCRLVRHVCWQVSQRAAHLAGAGVAAVITRLERNDVTVAVDGSLYRFHPHFKDLMNKKISQLILPWQQFKLVLAHDGSGQGAAIVAAVAKRCHDEKLGLSGALESKVDHNENAQPSTNSESNDTCNGNAITSEAKKSENQAESVKNIREPEQTVTSATSAVSSEVNTRSGNGNAVNGDVVNSDVSGFSVTDSCSLSASMAGKKDSNLGLRIEPSRDF